MFYPTSAQYKLFSQMHRTKTVQTADHDTQFKKAERFEVIGSMASDNNCQEAIISNKKSTY